MKPDMELSLSEVATVLGKSERQVRYLIKTERLKASKQGGRWSIHSEDLPLTAEQREILSKRVLKIHHYQRYMDDLVLFCNARAQLEDAREAAKEWLWRERWPRLKHPNAPPKSTKGAYTYLGYWVTRAGVYPTRTALRRMQNRISELVLDGVNFH